MKAYLVNSFRRNRGGAIFERQGANSPRSGSYVNIANQEEFMHFNAFICNGNFTIQSVARQQDNGPRREPIQTIFHIGDQIHRNVTIASFVLLDSDRVQILLSDGNSVMLANARHLNDQPLPIAEAHHAPARRGAVVVANDDHAAFLANLETQILEANPREIRLEATLRNRKTQTLEAFLKAFFETYNKERQTVYTDDRSVQTDTNQGEGRRRSLGDIFKICRYYYPTCTLRDVLLLLYIVIPAHYEAGFRSSYCSTINKRTFYYDPEEDNGVFDKNNNDEYGNRYNAVLAHLA